jgi:hypothetical protein
VPKGLPDFRALEYIERMRSISRKIGQPLKIFAVLCGVLIVLAPILIHAQQRKPLLGLALNVSKTGGTKELVDSILEEKRLGCTLIQNTTKWSDIEATPTDIKVAKLEQISKISERSASNLQLLCKQSIRTIGPFPRI